MLKDKTVSLRGSAFDDTLEGNGQVAGVGAEGSGVDSTRKEIRTDSNIPLCNLGGMTINRNIALGGMGVIQEGYDPKLQRKVAVKKPHPDLPPPLRETYRMRLIEEAQITAQLDHPNVVSVHELDVDESGEVYFSMKLVQGKELGELLREMSLQTRSRMDLFRSLQIFLKICDTVAFAHSVGVIHRDLKPSNVMVGDFGVVYLMDWGIARKLEAAAWQPIDAVKDSSVSSQTPSAVPSEGGAGTPVYMAPEQIEKDAEAIDERTDVFLLGGVLYEILTHEPPYDETGRAMITTDGIAPPIPRPETRVSVLLPQRLCDIAMKALARRKSDRYQSVLHLQRDIEDFMQSGGQLERRRYAPGDIVCREDDPGREAFVIESGRCLAFKTIDSKKVPLRAMAEGEVFGEIAVLTDCKRTASVEATSSLVLLVIKQSDFSDTLGMSPLLSIFMKTLAERFAEKDSCLTALQQEIERLHKYDDR